MARVRTRSAVLSLSMIFGSFGGNSIPSSRLRYRDYVFLARPWLGLGGLSLRTRGLGPQAEPEISPS